LRTLAKAGAAVVTAASGGLVLKYRRDLAAAERRLAQLDKRTVETVEGTIEYCEWGEGPSVLLVHGVVGGCDVPPSWRALVPSGYRIIAPSRFGYLGAAMPSKPSVAAQADVFARLLDALGIEQAIVLGFSAGSTSSVQFALRHPGRVRALVLVAANAPHEKPVHLVPRPLAPLVFSQPTLWSLRVFLPGKLAAIAGKPADYVLSEEDAPTLETIFDSFFPMRRRSKGCIFIAGAWPCPAETPALRPMRASAAGRRDARVHAIAKVGAVRGNAARLGSAPLLCLCNRRTEEAGGVTPTHRGRAGSARRSRASRTFWSRSGRARCRR
jgi:pimeloyl-ACP methyl ester carboxylesterase